jgi:hypothetical protein
MFSRLVKFSLLQLPLAVLLTSCSSPNSGELPSQPGPTKPAAASASGAPCLDRMKGFLRWYHRRFNADHDTTTDFFNMPLTGEEDSATLAKIPRSNISTTKYFQLNRPKLDVYIDTLRRSGYFSSSYLATMRASILERGQAVEEEKVTEGVLEGFDADEVMLTQDLYQLEDIGKLAPYQPANLKSGTSAYRLQLPSIGEENFSWIFFVKQENGRCVVDSVRTTE